MIKKSAKFIGGIISLIFLMSFSASADVSVYAEGAYTDSEIAVYIYADITDPIVSYGVKLTYDPDEVGSPTAVKNDDTWYFGTAASPLATPNADPDVSTQGEVVIVGGKLDESAPTEGVVGDRQLMAVVTFTRMDAAMPFEPTIGLELGKGGDYANFVQVDGTLMDGGVVFGATESHERGDVNADGIINVLDMGSVKNYMVNGGNAYPWMDCNSDGIINVLDMGCVKGIMTQQ